MVGELLQQKIKIISDLIFIFEALPTGFALIL